MLSTHKQSDESDFTGAQLFWPRLLSIIAIMVCITGTTLVMYAYFTVGPGASSAVEGAVGGGAARAALVQVDGKTFIAPTKEDATRLSNSLETVMRVLSLYQTQFEQRNRHMGNSGLTEVRAYQVGTKAYHQPLHGNSAIMNIHNHANLKDTMGMGEFAAVLNGVEFWTRHNDYRLVQPHKTDTGYHKTEPVPHPPVPPSVKGSVAAQITEMRKYFEAWAKQDTKIRDYRPYFKATLCYLEGAWIQDTANINEPFASDRHSIDAKSWDELFGKMKFLLNSGRKNNAENLPWLPTTVHNVQQAEQLTLTGDSIHEIALTTTNSDPARYYRRWNRRRARSDKMSFEVVTTSKGTYIMGVFDGRDTTEGKASLTIECKTPGCQGAKLEVVDDRSEGGAINKGSGAGLKWTWIGASSDGFMYGPIDTKVCWEVSFLLDAANTAGLDGYAVYSALWNNPETGSLGQPITIKGCQAPLAPLIANFEYRILCHQLKEDLPLRKLRLADDLASQLARGAKTRAQMMNDRRARFELDPSRTATKFYDIWRQHTFLDELMEQIPGKDNYAGRIEDVVFGYRANHYRRDKEILNAAYYSRFYSLQETDAMGRSKRKRGFNDDTLWAAMTTQVRVSPLGVVDKGKSNKSPPKQVTQRWSWAIPIEIVYMTPLSTWNPYNIKYYPRGDKAYNEVTAGGRNGGLNAGKAFKGSSYREFYITPSAFFAPGATTPDKADTASGDKGVLDQGGNLRTCRASGHWIHFPEIEGIGKLRQRYPIAPISDAKHLAFHEVTALKDILFASSTGYSGNNANALKNLAESTVGITLKMGASAGTTALHSHKASVVGDNVAQLQAGKTVSVATSQGAGHTHTLAIKLDKGKYSWVTCDGKPECFDKHPKELTKEN